MNVDILEMKLQVNYSKLMGFLYGVILLKIAIEWFLLMVIQLDNHLACAETPTSTRGHSLYLNWPASIGNDP